MTAEGEAAVANTNHRAAAPPLPHPPPQRRPRVREVSSRFMSPVSSSHSSGEPSKSLHPKQNRSVSSQRQRQHLEQEADENMPATCDTPRHSESPTNIQKKIRHSRTYSSDCSSKLFGRSTASTPLRPDTPTISTSLDRSSSIRLNNRSGNISSTAKASAAVKLLQSSGIALSSKPNTSIPSQELSANDSGRTALSLIDLGSSMPEVDANSNDGDSSELISRPLSRSLSTPLSSSEPSLFHHHPNALMKGKSAKMTPFSLPPVHTKSGPDVVRKSKKVAGHQEDLHSLKLLYNCYLQWRYANAKAETSTQTQKRETEKMLYSMEVKISELYDRVRSKRIELQLLQRMKNLSNILEAQMPYLEEWSDLQGDYLNSLSEAIQSLVNLSLRLPISGNVKADTREVGEAMASAVKLMEMIICHIQSFMPKAEEMESLVSELARLSTGERAVIEECGDLLYKTNTYQVEECSLRGQLIQLQAMVSCTDNSYKKNTHT